MDRDPLEDLRLDSDPGPARNLDNAAVLQMVRMAMGKTPTQVRQTSSLWLLAAAALLVAAGALARGYAMRHPVPSAPLPVLAVPQPSAPQPVVNSPPPSPPADEPIPVPPAAPTSTSTSSLHRNHEVSDLLATANALRGNKQWRLAERAYARVFDVAPGSPESQVARVAAAQLRLDHLGDPVGAEQLFAQAGRRGGELAQESTWGIVEARRARGDVAGEKAAIGDYLARFPSGAMAESARARLGELSKLP